MKRFINYHSVFTMACAFLLIFVGALVKSTESGLAVPDWPTTYGQNMFTFPLSSMVGGIFYEHSHRLLASFVGLCILILTVFIYLSDYPKYIKYISFSTLCAVLIQGILGGLTVLYFLPTWISVCHGTLGQTTFCLTIILATITSQYWNKLKINKPVKFYRKLSIITTISIWIQLIIGAIVRHTESALVAFDFPKINGKWIPDFSQSSIDEINAIRFYDSFNLDIDFLPITLGQLIFHFLHRIWGYGVFLLILYFIIKIYPKLKKYNILKFSLITSFALITLQILLGALTILSKKDAIVASLHVTNGAVILGIMVYISLILHRNKFSN